MANHVIGCVLGGNPKKLDNVETVQDVVDAMGVTNVTASINGEPVSLDTELQDNDYVSLSQAVKGGL